MDVIKGLNMIPDNSIHLTFTSPPYNTLERSGGYDNNNDNMKYDDYLKWLENVFELVYNKTIDGGRLIINIDATTNRQEDNDKEYIRAIYPHLYQIMKRIGWLFRTEICWTKSEAVGKKTAWGSYCSPSNLIIRRNHEYILVWSKKKWKLDSDEKPDITKKEFHEWTLSHWDIRPETKNLAGHPAPFSEELAKRVIKLFSFPDQTVLDPFSGTGTTAVVSKRHNRHYNGIDNSEKYCNYARDRLEKEDQTERIFLPPKKKNPKKPIIENILEVDYE